jgi:hypothetical protein
MVRPRKGAPDPDKPCIHCGEPSIAKSLCWVHYSRQRLSLALGMDAPVRRPKSCDIPWCDETTTLEYCQKHMDNLRTWGTPVAWAKVPLTPEAIEKFWSSVLIRNRGECWPWQGSIVRPNKKGAGYGVIYGNSRRLGYAHRIAWTLVNRKPVPAGKVITWPVCRFTLCMNAYDHLTAVTRSELAAPQRK